MNSKNLNNMSKKLVLPIAFLFITLVSMGQQFDAGLIAGFNATQVEGDDFRGYHKPGILAGLFVQTDLSSDFFASLELKYSQKGSRNRIRPEDEDIRQYIMRLGYAEVPVLVGYRTNEWGAVIGGISTGYLLHSGEYDENGLFPPQDTHEFNKFDLQPFLGFQFGLLEQLKVDLRLAFSVLPIRDQPGEDATNYYWLNHQFNNVISLALYYNMGVNQ